MKERYLEKIIEILRQIDNVWILEQIFRFTVNITK